jgi:RNA polymerase sigma-70 factor, ECF subfamily
MEILEKARGEGWTDEEVVNRVLAGEIELYEIIMRRYNQRLYRVVISILRDGDETEDVMQEAYVRAYEHLRQFEGRAAFSTWLTRIAVHEALARLRKWERILQLGNQDEGEISVNPASPALDPEQTISKAELSRMLEEAMLGLPEQYRTVLMLRDVEEMSTSETAAALSLSEENIKVRLHRGHAMVRRDVFARVGAMAKDAFPFLGARCDRIVERVFERLSASKSANLSL